MRKAVGSLAFVFVVVMVVSSVYASSYGQNSFMYSRYGLDFGPTYKFYYLNGSTSPQTSCDTQDGCTYVRQKVRPKPVKYVPISIYKWADLGRIINI